MTVINMDCRAGMAAMPANSVDALVTDPPYGLSKHPNMHEVLKHWLAGDDYTATGGGFMGKSWDSFVPGPKTWEQAFRILKPGGYAVVFAGSRTVDLMSVSLRLAGFEVVDMLHWMYGVGFPKSMNISAQLDKRDGLGAKRDVQLRFTEWCRSTGLTSGKIDSVTGSCMGSHYTTAATQPSVPTRVHFELMRPHFGVTVPAWVEAAVEERTMELENTKKREVIGHHTDPALAARWREGCGGGAAADASAITTAYSDEAKKWGGWGTALKPCHEPIILCRKPLDGTYANNIMTHGVGALNIDGCRLPWQDDKDKAATEAKNKHSDFDSGPRDNRVYGEDNNDRTNYSAPGRWPGNVLHDGCLPEPMDRYFYCAKATQKDRNEGLEDFEHHSAGDVTGGREEGSAGLNSPRSGAGRTSGGKNTHPTVKPTEVMRWLVRLITPPGGLVADPFCGSGSTLKAAALEGVSAIGWELEPESARIAQAREAAAKCKKQST